MTVWSALLERVNSCLTLVLERTRKKMTGGNHDCLGENVCNIPNPIVNRVGENPRGVYLVSVALRSNGSRGAKNLANQPRRVWCPIGELFGVTSIYLP